MNKFPVLPVLEQLKTFADVQRNHKNVYILAVQHLLETTGSLFESIIDIGINPKNIYLLGKIYSTNSVTRLKLKSLGINVYANSRSLKFGIIRETQKKDISSLWKKVKPKLEENDIVIILDDGGLAIKLAPKDLFNTCKFYGIEQTTFGLRYQENRDHFPIIQVATSAAKKYLEPNLIASALKKKIGRFLKNKKTKNIGIIGFGNIGKSVAHKLSKYFKVYVYDVNSTVLSQNMGSLKACSSIKEILSICDTIIGATGVDISESNWDDFIESEKIFISVSSSDIEFNSLLKKYNIDFSKHYLSPLDNLEVFTHKGHKLTFYRGGTVANFDGSKESCPMKQIQLTRGLLFAGILQALQNNLSLKDENGSIMLKATYQNEVVNLWLKSNQHFKKFYPIQLIENFKSINWIELNSGGKIS